MAKSKKNKDSQEEKKLKKIDVKTAEAEAIPSEDYEALKNELEESKAEVAAKQDELLRSLAEFSNYKKRMERDQLLQYQTMKGDIIKRFLPVMDDLARALQNAPEDPWVEGIQLIYRKLESILEAEGIQRIEAEGADFDPNYHEAIAQIASDEHESGQVVEVLQHGYLLGERVIRPAMVRVAE